jgi:uncharacterized iron-regulated membrane protein
MGMLLPFLALAVTGTLLTRPSWFREGKAWTAYAVSPADPSFHMKADALSLWASRDGGKVFTEIPTPGGVQDVKDLAFTPDGKVLYVAQKELGLLRGEEAVLWDQVPLPFDPVTGREFLEGVQASARDRLILRTTGAVWAGELTGEGWKWAALASFGTSDLYRDLHAWHSGWRFGPVGMRIVEVLGWLSILLAFTGVALLLKTRGGRVP